MPSLQLTTNVKIEDKRQFVLDFSKFSAQTLIKPEKYISVSVNYDEHLTFAGTLEPAFLMTITSLDNISAVENEAYSVAFFDYFADKLKIRGDRGYITFYDPGRAFLGHQGTTFQTLFNR